MASEKLVVDSAALRRRLFTLSSESSAQVTLSAASSSTAFIVISKNSQSYIGLHLVSYGTTAEASSIVTLSAHKNVTIEATDAGVFKLTNTASATYVVNVIPLNGGDVTVETIEP